MINLTEDRNGWQWPKDDINCWNYMMSHPDLPKQISKHVPTKKVCIQAGGNMGYYVKQYAEIFDTVYTYEPEPINFFCLNYNVQNQNVFKYQACLGNDRKLVDLKIKTKNRGKNYINGIGQIPTLLIDDLNLSECNLIHLDIEGYEYYALLGSLNTIKRCKPVITLELNGLAEKYNHTNNDVKDLVFSLGYKEIGTVDDDAIFKFYG